MTTNKNYSRNHGRKPQTKKKTASLIVLIDFPRVQTVSFMEGRQIVRMQYRRSEMFRIQPLLGFLYQPSTCFSSYGLFVRHNVRCIRNEIVSYGTTSSLTWYKKQNKIDHKGFTWHLPENKFLFPLLGSGPLYFFLVSHGTINLQGL